MSDRKRKKAGTSRPAKKAAVDMEVDDDEMMAAVDDEAGKQRVLAQIAQDDHEEPEDTWDPRRQLEEGDELEMDPRAYTMLHKLDVEWPCLSFDVVRDELGGGRTVLPHSCVIACGSQAATSKANRLTLLSVSNLSEMDDDSDSEDEDQASASSFAVPHPGTVNRVACGELIATFSEEGFALVWDLREATKRLGESSVTRSKKPAARLAHDSQGYALAWSRNGRLASGDDSGAIKTWAAPFGAPATAWRAPAAVEDVAWSPTEETVLVSGGGDRAVRVWDTRHSTHMLEVPDAHSNDINSLSWNNAVSYLLATSGDDGVIKVWDLRTFGGQDIKPVGRFTWHAGHSVTSVQWDPHDESALAVAADDNSVTLWDLSVEDESMPTTSPDDNNTFSASSLPPQLLFIHQGLTDPKEVKHHPQIPRMIITTAADGLSFFIPALHEKESS